MIRALHVRSAGASVAKASRATATGPTIRVAVGALGLPGLSVRDGDRFAAAFTRDLTTRLSAAAPSTAFASDALRIDPLPRARSVVESAEALAAAVFEVLTDPRGTRA